MIRELFGKFFAYYFSGCYNSTMYYRNLEFRIKQFECSIVTKISEGIASLEAIIFSTLR